MLALTQTVLACGMAMPIAGAFILTRETLRSRCDRIANSASNAATVDSETSSESWHTSVAIALLAWSPLVISAALLAAWAS
jgi:hypothetical protein